MTFFKFEALIAFEDLLTVDNRLIASGAIQKLRNRVPLMLADAHSETKAIGGLHSSLSRDAHGAVYLSGYLEEEFIDKILGEGLRPEVSLKNVELRLARFGGTHRIIAKAELAAVNLGPAPAFPSTWIHILTALD